MKLDEVAGPQQVTMIYVDMDGVLADFVTGIKKIFPTYDESRYQSDPKYRSEQWKRVAKYSKEGGKLWLELPEMADAKQLMNFVQDYNHEILSATGNPAYGAEPQKRTWISSRWPVIKVNLVHKSTDKAQYATPESILIDDQRKSIDPWIKAGGIGILHKNAAQTINELKKILNRGTDI